MLFVLTKGKAWVAGLMVPLTKYNMATCSTALHALLIVPLLYITESLLSAVLVDRNKVAATEVSKLVLCKYTFSHLRL